MLVLYLFVLRSILQSTPVLRLPGKCTSEGSLPAGFGVYSANEVSRRLEGGRREEAKVFSLSCSQPGALNLLSSVEDAALSFMQVPPWFHACRETLASLLSFHYPSSLRVVATSCCCQSLDHLTTPSGSSVSFLYQIPLSGIPRVISALLTGS